MATARQSASERMRREVLARSPFMTRFFTRVFARTLRAGFHAVRVANRPSLGLLATPELVVYSNHASWWDAVTYLCLADLLFPGRPVYTPIDAAMAQRYGFMRRIGSFGIARDDPRGLLDFVEACRVVFAQPRSVLLVAAQGRFADPRERPLRLGPGIGLVADVAPSVTFLPLAIEYPFWLERRPELLLRFGPPIDGKAFAALGATARLESLEAALGATMDELGRAAIARDASAFEVLSTGRRGIHPLYDLWQRLAAGVRGVAWRGGHGPPP